MLGARSVGNSVQIGDERLDVLDERPLPRRPSVADVIRGVDDGAESDEHVRHVLVTTGMFAVAVSQHGDEPGRVVTDPCGDVDLPRLAVELVTRTAHPNSSIGG